MINNQYFKQSATYVWEKYSAEQDTYSYYVEGAYDAGSELQGTIDGSSSYVFNSYDGTFATTGDVITIGAGQAGTVYAANGNQLTRCTNTATGYRIQQKTSTHVSGTRWVKGDTDYGAVASLNANAYPQDGYQDGYWYVKK